MGLQEEAVVLSLIEGTQKDVAAVLTHDCAWKVYMPDGPLVRGRDAVVEHLERLGADVDATTVKVGSLASNDRVVMVERTMEIRHGGHTSSVDLAAVVEFEDGRITGWRDYCDLLQLDAEARADLEARLSAPGASGDSPVPEATGDGLAMPPTTADTPEQQSIVDFCALWGNGTLERKPEVESIVARMTPDAQWKLWAPGGPVIAGRDALRTEIRRQMEYATRNHCHVVRAVSTPWVVMQERSDWAVMRDRPCPHQMVAIYELDEAGLVTRWREYINMADLDRKRGVPAVTAHEAD